MAEKVYVRRQGFPLETPVDEAAKQALATAKQEARQQNQNTGTSDNAIDFNFWIVAHSKLEGSSAIVKHSDIPIRLGGPRKSFDLRIEDVGKTSLITSGELLVVVELWLLTQEELELAQQELMQTTTSTQ